MTVSFFFSHVFCCFLVVTSGFRLIIWTFPMILNTFLLTCHGMDFKRGYYLAIWAYDGILWSKYGESGWLSMTSGEIFVNPTQRQIIGVLLVRMEDLGYFSMNSRTCWCTSIDGRMTKGFEAPRPVAYVPWTLQPINSHVTETCRLKFHVESRLLQKNCRLWAKNREECVLPVEGWRYD